MASPDNESGSVEDELKDLLKGSSHTQRTADMILDEHSKARRSDRGIGKPVVGDTVCYVAVAVVFNDRGQVLLTREGFKPCYGQWYLPAGRVDPMETLAEASVRELREETGMEMKATSLLVVEHSSPSWCRFTFTGQITGGALRTQANADSETLEAGWWDVADVKAAAMEKSRGLIKDPMKSFDLRGGDIIPLIELARHYYDRSPICPPGPPAHPLPSVIPLQSTFLRPLVICNDPEGYSMVCVSDAGTHRIPLLDTGMTVRATKSAIMAFIKLLGIPLDGVAVRGVVAVEHDGRERYMDGLCFTVLVTVAGPPTTLTNTRFTWRPLSDNMKPLVDARCQPYSAITLHGR